MRILFNHGLTPAELYTNTPEKIATKHWRWWVKHYGSSNSYGDSLAGPFKYCFALIINRMIDEKMRFKIPHVPDSYLDFEIVTGDDFVEQRQNGRFREIDFVESDFTGYFLRYYFKAKAYKKSYPIYLGGELKEKFLDKINEGNKFYTTKDLIYKDFLDEVHNKFSELTKEEVKNLLLHGFRRMHSAMKYGCAISISTRKILDCTAHIGELSLNPQKQIKAYSIRRDRKLRKIEGWKRPPFDGYYYIGLNPPAFKEWLELNEKTRSVVKFKNVIPRKIQLELYYKFKKLHIFRIKIPKFRGWAFWADDISNKHTTYVGEVENLVFKESNKSWKEIRKEYETKEFEYV